MGCRDMKPKKELLRIVRAPDGTISLDLTGKKPGRGAYICSEAECLKKMIRQKQVERVLAANIDASVLEEIQAAAENKRQEHSS
jgi:predicted RNA-binding protein YlxR (DUF448 family)